MTTLRFLNHVGDEPTYSVPDAGEPTHVAMFKSPSGKTVELEEVGRSPGHPAQGELPEVGPRAQFLLPRLTKEGVYTLTFDELVYEITVVDSTARDFTDQVRAWQNEGDD